MKADLELDHFTRKVQLGGSLAFGAYLQPNAGIKRKPETTVR